MHSSSAQRLQRLRVITNHLLKSIHNFRQIIVLNGARVRIQSVLLIVTLLGTQLYLWHGTVMTNTAQVLSTQIGQQTGENHTAEIIAPVRQSEISRLEIPAAGISAPVLDVQAVGTTGAAAHMWYMTHYAVGHHENSGLPGQGKNIIFSAVSGDYGRMLASLDRAIPGSTITLYAGDNQHSYTVISQQLIPANSTTANTLIDASMASNTNDEQVTLITRWPPSGGKRYAQYLVVVAKPAS